MLASMNPGIYLSSNSSIDSLTAISKGPTPDIELGSSIILSSLGRNFAFTLAHTLSTD